MMNETPTWTPADEAMPMTGGRGMMYRYVHVRYAPMLDEFETPERGGRLAVELCTYDVTKKTPKGAWLDIGKFVLDGSKKRFAHETKALAIESFVARKRRQLSILEAQASDVRHALALAQNVWV